MILLVKNAIVIDPSQGIAEKKDFLVKKGFVEAIDSPGSFEGLEVDRLIDASGKWLVPGFIDLHVHLRDPGQHWKETIATGTKAAIDGGYTTICAMPNTEPVNDNAEVTNYILGRAEDAQQARVVPIGSVSIGLQGKQMSPISELYHAGCPAFSDDGMPIHNSGLMKRALEWCLRHDAVICCHEEDCCLSCGGVMNESPLSYKLGLKGMSTLAEDVMVARDIEIARYTGGKIHICHISSARGVELVRRAKNDGIRITCEVTPHHLYLGEEHLESYDANYKMSPPLRDPENRQALIDGLCDGTIDAIASDHAPHEPDSKLRAFDEATMGILGLQTSLPVLLDFYHRGIINQETLVRSMSTNPAKIFSLDAGNLKPGARADFTIIDPEKNWSFEQSDILSKSINSPFVGKKFKGFAEYVVVNGNILKGI